MTSPKQYSVIADVVYKVDSIKEGLKNAQRVGDTFFENKDNSGQEYQILYTVDTNDKYNSQGYEKNGFQGMAVAPVGVDGIPDYNGTLDSQFTSALQFYDEMAKIYGANNIEAVTGHSLGGSLAQKVAAANHIPAVTFSTAGVGKQLTEEEKVWINGEGKKFVLNFMHKGDQISSWTNASDYGTAIYAGDFGDGSLLSGHFLDSYKFDKNGAVRDIKGGIWTITDKGTLSNGIELIQKNFKEQLKTLSELEKRLSASGGCLSSGEKLYLDSAQALAIVSTASLEFNLAMENVIKVYQNGIKEAEELWKKTVDDAMKIGNQLEQWEIYEALERGGSTEYNIVTLPTQQYQMKISKVRGMAEQFKSLENQIKAKISEIVARDSELAQQLKG